MPEKLSFALDKEYKIKTNGSDIILDLVFGDVGQSPDTTVKLNTKVLLSEFKESIDGFIVGQDRDLDGKNLRINGNIADTSRESNKISLRLKISGGTRELTKEFNVTVADEGEVVIFSLVIRFFA